jgi:hypothetical protein
MLYMSGTSKITYVVNHSKFNEALVDECSSPVTYNQVQPPRGVAKYSADPLLPEGLSINKFGQILGKPKHIQPCMNYTFTAANCGGSASFTQEICVIPEPFCEAKNAVYNGPTELTLNVKAAPWAPLELSDAEKAAAVLGGAKLVYNINKPLPKGMQLDVSTGLISGTPTELSNGTSCSCESYTVTASNGIAANNCAVTFCMKVVSQTCVLDWLVPETFLVGSLGMLNGGRIPGTMIPYYVGRANTSAIMAMGDNLIGPNAALTSCTINKPLLPGLKLEMENNMCMIRGTPTTLSGVGCPTVQYKVTGHTMCGKSCTKAVGMKSIAIAPTRLHFSGSPHVVLTVDGGYKGKIFYQTPSADGDPVTNYSSTPLPGGLVLDTKSGHVSGKCLHVGSTEVTFTASNCGGSDTFKQIIECIPEEPKCLTYGKHCDNTTKVIVARHQVCMNATLGGGYAGGAMVTYSITPALPAGLVFNTQTAEICGKPLDVICPNGKTWTATATNAAGSTSTELTLTILADTPIVEYQPKKVTHDVLGHKYTRMFTQIWHNKSFTPIDITNVGGPFSGITSCQVVGDQLPKGLTLSAQCQIGGIAQEMSWPPKKYEVNACNCGGCDTAVFMLGVRAIPPTATSMTNGKCARYVVGNAIAAEFNLVDVDSGRIVTTSVKPALPAGLSLNHTDGTLIGIPTKATRETNYTFTVSNSGGSASFVQKLEILGSPPAPWRYQASNFLRSSSQCSMSDKYRMERSIATCSAAKDSAQAKVAQLSSQKATAEKALQGLSTEVTVLRAANMTASTQLVKSQASVKDLTAKVANCIKQDSGKSASMEVTTQPSSVVAAGTNVAATVTMSKSVSGLVIASLSGVSSAKSAFLVSDGVATVAYPATTTGKFSLLLQFVSSDGMVKAKSVTSNAFTVVAGAPTKLLFTTQPPAVTPADNNFDVAASLTDKFGNAVQSQVTGTLSAPGANFTAQTITFTNGAATTSAVSLAAGKWYLMLKVGSLSAVSAEVRSTVTPVTFNHTISGMDDKVWNITEVQDSYKQTMSNTMSNGVEKLDVTITHSYTTTRRAGTTQTTVTTKVALVDGTTAKKSVANLEQSTGNGNFDKTWKTLAAQQGVTLGDAVSSGKIEGTSSATMVVPKKYQATQHESSSSSSEQGWKIAAICLMALFGVAFVSVLIAFTVLNKKKVANIQDGVAYANPSGDKAGSDSETEVVEQANPAFAATTSTDSRGARSNSAVAVDVALEEPRSNARGVTSI